MVNWVWTYFSLGLVILAAGVVFLFLKARTVRLWLAFAQTILGSLVVISLIAFVLWVEPDWAPYTRLSDYTGNLVLISHDPGWVATQLAWKAASILTGLAVAGLGFMQLHKLRKTAVSSKD